MSALDPAGWLQALGGIDPAPFFGLSLLPYLAFLWWSWKSGRMPRLALWGFALTLLFVAVTIAAALIVQGHSPLVASVAAMAGGAFLFGAPFALLRAHPLPGCPRAVAELRQGSRQEGHDCCGDYRQQVC